MGRIPDEIIQRVRDQADIVELVGRSVALKRAGRSYKGLCPFHDEKTPSFHVNPDRGGYYCFGCQEGGDVFSFLMKVEGLSFTEAVRSLARDLGIEVPETGGDANATQPLLDALARAQQLFRRCYAEEGNPAAAYWAGRGLAPAEAERFEVGFAPDAWDTLAAELERARVTARVGEQAGLLAPRQGGSGHYDRLRGRLVFPIRDARDRIIGFGGRALAEGQEPKYLNTPESPVFRKREAFYGLPAALAAIRQNDRVVVVEGYFDRIALARAGVEESLATCGTSLTEGHARALRRRTRNAVLLYDGDEAGLRAMERSLEVLLPAGLRVRAGLLPAGCDPHDLLTREGPEALRKVVEEAPAALDFVIERAVARGIDTPWAKADAVAAVAPLLAAIPSGVERSEFARGLALAVGTELRHVDEAVRAAARGEDARDAVPVVPRTSGAEARKLDLLACCVVEHPELVERFERDDALDLVPAGPQRDVIAAALAARQAGSSFDVSAADALEPEAATLLRRLAVADHSMDAKAAGRTIDDTLSWLRRQRVRARQRELTQSLRSESADAQAILSEKERLQREKQATAHPAPARPMETPA